MGLGTRARPWACAALAQLLPWAGDALELRPARGLTSASEVATRESFGVSLEGCFGVACLERFTAFHDGGYSWRVVSNSTQTEFRVPLTSHRLSFSSQIWAPSEGKPGQQWWHDLEVVVPSDLTADSKAAGWALLLINEAPELAREFAARTGLITASLSDTPPRFMSLGGPFPTFEEDVKATSWANFAKEPDRPWPIEMPTAKAVVRAMDAVTEFTASLRPSTGLPPATSFAVSGWSKRAVATYMVGGIDPRVKLIVPVSHPVNLDVQGRLSYMNLGETVTAAKVYDLHRVYGIHGPVFAKLESLIDPVSYLDHLVMPKLLMMCGRDDFFAPDSTRTWWGDLPSPKSFYLAPNFPHSGFIDPIRDQAVSFIFGTVHGKAMPMIDWTIDNSTGDIHVRQISDHTPLKVTVWSADTPTGRTRDFRRATYAEVSGAASAGADGRSWVVHAERPQVGWRAVLCTLEYAPIVPRSDAPTYKLSTEVSVVPATRPFAPDPTHLNYVFR